MCGTHPEKSHMFEWCVAMLVITNEFQITCVAMELDYYRGVLYSDRKQSSSPQSLPRVMLTFAKTHLYPTWKLHSNANINEIESPLTYAPRVH